MKRAFITCCEMALDLGIISLFLATIALWAGVYSRVL